MASGMHSPRYVLVLEDVGAARLLLYRGVAGGVSEHRLFDSGSGYDDIFPYVPCTRALPVARANRDLRPESAPMSSRGASWSSYEAWQ